MRRPSKPKIRTKERYILDSVVSIFKGGHWVEDSLSSLVSPSQENPPQDRGGGVSAPENGSCGRTEQNYGQSLYVTVIGGQKYDPGRFHEALAGYLHRDEIVVGAGRGVESDITKGWPAKVIPVDPDRFGKNARKCNVEEVLCYAIDSPLLLVGSGERVKQAKAWLERTKSRREVIELP